MKNFNFKIDPNSRVLKFQQLIELVASGINAGDLQQGDPLPSVNQMIKESNLSRDTVFKAYAELRRRGLVDSIPNKGYFVARREKRVLLFLDTLKAYKEVLYDEFKNSFPSNYVLDVNFHHYNIDIFESVILNGIGKYDKCIVMNFDNDRIPQILDKLDARKVCIIDWKIHAKETQSRVYQDFGSVVYRELSKHKEAFTKYNKFVCVYPDDTYHPAEGITEYKHFCSENGIQSEVITKNSEVDVTKGHVYLCFEDFTLAQILEQCKEKGFVLGTDIGVLSYNDTPMKKFIEGGISVISTDFRQLGTTAARFITTDEYIDQLIETKLIDRGSI